VATRGGDALRLVTTLLLIPSALGDDRWSWLIGWMLGFALVNAVRVWRDR
jgi:hypothetical protein